LNLLELGSSVRKLRKEKHITQEKLAKMTNISRATLSKLENGQIAQVSIVTLNNILNSLGYEIDINPLNPFITKGTI